MSRPQVALEAARLAEALAPQRARIFPDLDEGWILHRDEDLLVVDKPAGVPCMAPRPPIADDLPSRLERALGLRLGTHQRLDADTSGVLAYSLSDTARASLARQFEARTVGKEYLACVVGWRGGRRTLDAPVDGKRAVSHVEPLERSGERTLLRVTPTTGRRHQIRAHLAGAGCPVAGDPRFGGPPTPRLLLHSHRLSLREGAWTAPMPEVFRRWLRGVDGTPLDDPQALRETLDRAMRRRWWLGRAASQEPPTTCFRLLHGEGDGAAGLAVDVYGEHLVAHLYDAGVAHEETILDALEGLGFAGVYVKRRPRQANVLVDPRRQEVAPAEPLRGVPASEPLWVVEEGMPFPVALGDGLSTGLFLDQRDTRARLRASAQGRSVLNLFAYTGAFSVAAALGGARRIASVDASAAALRRAEETFAALGLEGHESWRHDCFEALRILSRRGERFDLLIADPPTYSRVRKRRWTSGRDWVGLVEAMLSVAAPGAELLLSSNDGRMSRKAFRRHVREAARRARVEVAQLKDLPTPPDFPASVGHEPALKRLWLRLGRGGPR